MLTVTIPSRIDAIPDGGFERALHRGCRIGRREACLRKSESKPRAGRAYQETAARQRGIARALVKNVYPLPVVLLNSAAAALMALRMRR